MDCLICPQTAGDIKGKGQGKTAKGSGYFIASLMFFLALLPPPLLQAKQDSARLTFQKTVGKSPDKIHVVKKGESLLSIIKNIRNRKPVSLSQVRRLNPGLRDINRIYPGQKIVLPSYEQADAPAANLQPEKQTHNKPSPYLIKKNDSISRILLDKLQTGTNDHKLNPEETIETYRKILQLNPDIVDMNNLPAGHTLLLPPNLAQTAAPKAMRPDKETESAKTHPALRALLTSIRPTIALMNGSLNASGSYFIPLQDSTQISIDCSLIPSVELDDGTTVFLDYENRLNDDIKRLIRQYWQSYYFLINQEMQSAAGTLQGIIGHAKSYKMTRVEKPLMLTAKPEIAVSPDWIISGNKKTEGSSQGIFLLAPGEPPLPETVKLFLAQNGLTATQIAEKRISSDHPPDNLQIVREDLSALQGVALAERLLTVLGEKPLLKAEVAIFKQAENGFNLSITADILLRKGAQKLIVHSKKLPDQFIKILNNSGFTFLNIGANDKGRTLVESVLRGAGLPAALGYFSSRIPKGGGRSRLDISFSALSSVKDNEQIYLADFDIPDWVVPTIYGGPKVLLIRY